MCHQASAGLSVAKVVPPLKIWGQCDCLPGWTGKRHDKVHFGAAERYSDVVWASNTAAVAMALCTLYFVHLKGIPVVAVGGSDPGRNGALSHDGKADGNGADIEKAISAAAVTAELAAKAPVVAVPPTEVGWRDWMCAAVAYGRLLPLS